MALSKLSPAGPNDEFTTWSWLKKLQTWLAGTYYPNTSSTAALTLGGNFFYPIDATSGNIVVTLPVDALQLGKKYIIKKTDSSSHTVTVTADTTKPDLIDGAATKVLSTQYDSIYIESDGVSNWWKLAGGAVAGSSTGPAMIVGTSAPGTAVSGDFWWKSDEGQLKIYYTDANTSQWVDAMNLNTGAGTGVTGGGLTKIAQVITTGSQATVSFSSIPATYSSLIIDFQSRDTAAGTADSNIFLQFNGDATSGNYVATSAVGDNGTSAVRASPSSSANGAPIVTHPNNGATSGFAGAGTIIIPAYARTVFHKQALGTCYESFGTGPTPSLYNRGFTWKSTAAINAAVLTAGTAFVDGSIFTLYGRA